MANPTTSEAHLFRQIANAQRVSWNRPKPTGGSQQGSLFQRRKSPSSFQNKQASPPPRENAAPSDADEVSYDGSISSVASSSASASDPFRSQAHMDEVNRTERVEKQTILEHLSTLHPLHGHNMDTNLRDIRYTYETHKAVQSSSVNIDFMKSIMTTGIGILEMITRKSRTLNGFSDLIRSDVNAGRYDRGLKSLETRIWRNATSVSPFLELAFLLFQSLMSCVIRNRMNLGGAAPPPPPPRPAAAAASRQPIFAARPPVPFVQPQPASAPAAARTLPSPTAEPKAKGMLFRRPTMSRPSRFNETTTTTTTNDIVVELSTDDQQQIPPDNTTTILLTPSMLID